MLLLVLPYKKLYSFLCPKLMSCFLTRQIDVIHAKNCLPPAEENEVNAEGNEVNTAAARVCLPRQSWHPQMS